MKDEYFSNRNYNLLAAWPLIAYYNCMGEGGNAGCRQPWFFLGWVSLKERNRILNQGEGRKRTHLPTTKEQNPDESNANKQGEK